ncbi:DUF2290 domain-containing protein [Bacillus marinisedimentorum]|uniref:DUF2290 domain-containing protein n=1 Tax=Bacillus marinisedimentorum TaxID=1821260 RepID=UPI000872815F|nr:DUF2290 domain-containing protein [Bacillus marinisedimentorum]
MNIGSFLSSLRDVKYTLKEAELLKEINTTREITLDFGKFSESFLQVFQKNDYSKIYRTAMENNDYDFLLTDDSFFQFSCTPKEGNLEHGSIRYAYYENPRNYPTYEEFIETIGFSYEQCRDEFQNEYEQSIAEAKLKNTVTPIRYDYDFQLYEPIHHPISHIHIGHNNELRLPSDKILTPAKFVNFVLQNTYRRQWKSTFQNDKFRNKVLTAKRRCFKVDDSYFTRDEQEFLFIV